MSDVDEILERTPTELEHNRALEKEHHLSRATR
jgi:hypothetical protein